MGTAITRSIVRPPILRLANATFFREHPNSNNTVENPPLFPDTNLEIWHKETKVEYWAVVGPAGSGKTTFLEALNGRLLCDPPQARTHPYLPQVGATGKRFDQRIMRNRDPSKAIRYAGFGGKGAKLSGVETRGTYMAARYESRQEAGDFSLKDYLLGNTEANPFQAKSRSAEKADALRLGTISRALQLDHLLDQPAFVLSNGQTRRARIGKAFMEYPLLLLLDEPFLGIDPIQYRILSPAIWNLSRRSGPSLVLALSNDKTPPRWVTHLICLDNCKIVFSGPIHKVYEEALAAGYPLSTAGQKRSLWKATVVEALAAEEENEDNYEDENDSDHGISIDADHDLELENAETQDLSTNTNNAIDLEQVESEDSVDGVDGESTDTARYQHTGQRLLPPRMRRPMITSRWDVQNDITQTLEIGEPVIEMKGVQVNYGELVALGNWQDLDQQKPGLHWSIRRGERWGIFGPNGSGKTTILSLVNSDHPKSYSQEISYFGRSRLPEPGQPGISIFDLQSRIMQASPEVHAFFPKYLSIRATLENAWADTFLSRPKLTHLIDSTVDAVLRWFEKELNPQCTGSDPLDVLSEWTHTPGRKPQDRVSIYQERRLDWADTLKLSEISFAAQRVALFLRAIIKKPDVIILDEAFSGMDKETRIKCMMFLAYGETKALGILRRRELNERYMDDNYDVERLGKFETPLVEGDIIKVGPFESRQALVVVAHEEDEIPPLVDKYLFLEEPGSRRPPRIGEIPNFRNRAGRDRSAWWHKLWNPSVQKTNSNRYWKSYPSTT